MKSTEQDITNSFAIYSDAVKLTSVTDSRINDIKAKICGEDGWVDPEYFILVQFIVFSAMDQEYFVSFHQVSISINIRLKC